MNIRSLLRFSVMSVIVLVGCTTTREYGQPIAATSVKRIAVGMTEKQVMEAIGQPGQISLVPPQAGGGKVWTYRHTFVVGHSTGFATAQAEHESNTVTVSFGKDGLVSTCTATRMVGATGGSLYSGTVGTSTSIETSCAEVQ